MESQNPSKINRNCDRTRKVERSRAKINVQRILSCRQELNLTQVRTNVKDQDSTKSCSENLPKQIMTIKKTPIEQQKPITNHI